MWASKLYAVKWWCHRTCARIAMQISCFTYTVILHSDLTLAIVVAGMLYSVWSELPHQERYPTVLFIDLWPHGFHKIMYFYSICLVSITCCDATITQHKRNTNIHVLRTNTLMIAIAYAIQQAWYA